MLEAIIDFLACPACKNPLNLHVQKRIDKEIISGNLTCNNLSCNKKYTISQGIPNFLSE
tara:strand:+ start:47 stop:223 length:177 start_codon:yes stop_codon:yes gene_type:complete